MEHVDEQEPRCAGCGFAKYGHAVAVERMIAEPHEWTPRSDCKDAQEVTSIAERVALLDAVFSIGPNEMFPATPRRTLPGDRP